LGGSAMPSFDESMDDEQLWHLTNYMHALSVDDPTLFNLRSFWFDRSDRSEDEHD